MNIRKINESKTPQEVFDMSIWKKQFRAWVQILHPDKNKDLEATKAYLKLVEYKEILENGLVFSDEFCPKILYKENILYFYGDMDKLKVSHDNFNRIKSLGLKSKSPFLRFLPEKMELKSDVLEVCLRHDPYLIHDRKIEEVHVRWFLNRLLEFSSLLNQEIGYTHAGINPNSIMICPKEHGIQVISFYHAIPVNSNMVTAIGLHPYKSWYPSSIFNTKKSTPQIDLLMSKRLGTYMLGEHTGFSDKLRGLISSEMFEYLITYEDSLLEGYFKYKEMIDRSPRIFHNLTL